MRPGMPTFFKLIRNDMDFIYKKCNNSGFCIIIIVPGFVAMN
jgi:hypothetical protein